MSSSESNSQDDSRFRPGQLGLKHLLAVLAIASVVMAFAGAQLRTAPLWRTGEFFLHWLAVGGLAAGIYYTSGLNRRQNRAAAGELVLVISWALLAAAVGSAILMSVVVLPRGILQLFASRPTMFAWIVVGQSFLWSACLDHWLRNIYWVEFRERGILLNDQFVPWSEIKRITWSPTKNGNLVVSRGGFVHELPIDPAAHDEVDALLKARSGQA
jgi:hypothetical protein